MSFDMTRGKPAPLLVCFALPLILSSMLQQLYTLFDSVIVGRLLGENAFAAVGAAAFLHGIPLSILLGCTQGFGVAVGQRFGAKDETGLTRFFSAAGLLSLGFGLLLSFLGLLFLRPLLNLMHTPEQLIPDSAGYLTVLWAGLAVNAVMNMAASGLRAIGDSRTPLFGLLLSSFLNILLDVLLVAVFPLGGGRYGAGHGAVPAGSGGAVPPGTEPGRRDFLWAMEASGQSGNPGTAAAGRSPPC